MPLADMLVKTEPAFVGSLGAKVANRPRCFQRDSEWVPKDFARRKVLISANISARGVRPAKNTHRGLTKGQTSHAVEWGLL